MTVDYQNIIAGIYKDTKHLLGQGKVADYIPALASVDSNNYGISVVTIDGQTFTVGDTNIPFSIQSISKVFSLTMVFRKLDEKIWMRVGREPSGTSFNSLILLETESGIPRNPFINAGALVVSDCLISLYDNPLSDLLEFVREQSNNAKIQFDSITAESERKAGYRNAALVNFMKSFGNIDNDVNDILNMYFHQCSIMMSCEDLARAFLYLANRGVNPFSNFKVLTESQAKRIKAIMQTCGLYDESGDFAYYVGLPAKSGVGGGIVAVAPDLLSVCVWSPDLNEHGNSLVGTKALELFTTRTGISVF